MPTPPLRSAVSGTPSRATANTGFGALWDYVTGLLGSTGDAAEAQTALGASAIGKSLFTAANAAAVRQAAGVPNSGPLSGLRNLIINGNFAINQRAYVSGAAVGAANTYTLDRWRVVTSGQSLTFTASGNGNLVTAPAGGIEQVIEGASIAGGTYVINWTGTASCTVGGTARAKGATFTLAAGTNATVRFSGGTVGEVQVEPGSVVTAFEARPIGLELMLCQRYGARFAGTLSTQLAPVTPFYPFPVPMRASPTISLVSVTSGSGGAVGALNDMAGFQTAVNTGISGFIAFASAEL